MLSRTAGQLYWMSRYLERAENLVRILDVTHSLFLMPQSRGALTELAAPLAVTGTLEAYQARYKRLEFESMFKFMALDLDNPTSVLSCLRQARENAHAVRGQITAEMWEAINATWLEGRTLPARGIPSVSSFFDWVKERSHLFRGATTGSMQRNDANCFIRLGIFIERADNTARLLDVKSQLIAPAVAELAPVDAPSDSAPDFYAWSALLRALSAFEAYHAAYRDGMDVAKVVELLVLRADLPRSLRACCDQLVAVLPRIEAKGGEFDAGRPVKRLAGKLQLRLGYGTADEIMAEGLHAWLTSFLGDTAELSAAIHSAYLEAN